MPPMPGSLKGGRYVLKQPIGDRALSEVYLGEDTHESRLIVIKLIRLDKNTFGKNTGQLRRLDKFKHEAGILVNLPHRHIVRIYDYGEEEQGNEILAYIVMYYYEEGSLQQWFRNRQEPLQVAEVAAILEQARDAVQYIHSRGLIHRDIKPHNFLVQSGQDPSALPTILLADFGLAQYVEGDMTQDGRGTPHYKAPERWDKDPPTAANDQYALAIMAYYLLTRRYPFDGDSAQLKWDHQNTDPAVPSTCPGCSHIPSAIDNVILRALDKKPEKRYGDVNAFVKAFREAIKPKPPEPVPPRPFSPKGVVKAIKTGDPGWVRPIAALTVALTIIVPLLVLSMVFPPLPSPTTNCIRSGALSPHPQSGDSIFDANPFVNAPGIKESMTDACGNVIGLSAGATIFDITSAENDEMQQAATALRNGNLSSALALFHTVTTTDPSNAEAWIYAENLRVLDHKLDYIAVVLGRDISSARSGTFRESLQGAYLAQEAYNQSAAQRNGPSLVVIIASSGANSENTAWVAKQIIALKRANPHIVGVVGWSTSSTSVNANAVLAHQPKENENVFMLAPSGSSGSLSGTPYFLRIVLPDIYQADFIAFYAYNALKYGKMAIIYNSDDVFTSDIRSSFKDAFTKKKGSIVSEQSYIPGDEPSLHTALSNALQSHPDGIYLAGFSADAGLLLSSPQIANLPSQFKILGGSAMASLNDYPASQPNLDRLVLVSYASQDEWQFLHVEQASEISTFAKSYESTFGVGPISLGVMLSYDAVNIFLQGYQKALANGGTDTCLPCALEKAFQSMNGVQAWRGVSGQIAFKSGKTEPVDKILLINVVEKRTTKTVDYRGCFRIDRTDCKN